MERRTWCWVVYFVYNILQCQGLAYINQFAIQCKGDKSTAIKIARDYGFTVERELPYSNIYILSHPDVQHRSKRNADHILDKLKSHPKVIYAQQEIELIRERRSFLLDKQLELPILDITDNSVYHRVDQPLLQRKDTIPSATLQFNDPYFKDQWYIVNTGQSGGVKDCDLNVMVAWKNGFTGNDVVVSILDDGVDRTHHDLADNYDPDASYDLDDGNKDPTPNKNNTLNSHGTRCAGVVGAVANNGICGVGVAFNAKIGGIRILDGKVTDSLEAEALNFNQQHIDIYSASWGPHDNGEVMEAPKHYTKEALQKGVREGRGGLGNIYVWATGNGGGVGDNCNADGYVSSIETLSIGSITDKGKRPFFMEKCASTVAVVPSGGEEVQGEELRHNVTKLKVITTDINNGCIENFQGTSSAAPIAAGCIALLLEAGPHLTWRDVQHIVVRTSRIPSVDNSWVINGAGLHVSHVFGYGVMDCGAMVQMAQNWNTVSEQHICTYNKPDLNTQIRSRGNVVSNISVDGCKDNSDDRVDRLEHVEVCIKIAHDKRGDIQIYLMSPAGTKSEILAPRRKDRFKGKWKFCFMSVHTWNEYPPGLWTLEVIDNPSNDSKKPNEGFLFEWSLILYGTSGQRVDRMLNYQSHQQQASVPKDFQITEIMDREHLRSKRVSIKSNTKFVNKETKTKTLIETDRIAANLLKLLLNEETNAEKRDFFPDTLQTYRKQNLDNFGRQNNHDVPKKVLYDQDKQKYNTSKSGDEIQDLIGILTKLTKV